MLVKSTKTIVCETCEKPVVLHEYKGIEGAWYSDHRCPPNKAPIDPPEED